MILTVKAIKINNKMTIDIYNEIIYICIYD